MSQNTQQIIETISEVSAKDYYNFSYTGRNDRSHKRIFSKKAGTYVCMYVCTSLQKMKLKSAE